MTQLINKDQYIDQYLECMNLISQMNSKENISSIHSIINTIYKYPEYPINKLLIKLQRECDFGYFCPYSYDLDKNNLPDEYYSFFGSQLSWLKLYDNPSNMYQKNSEYLETIYLLFRDVLIKYNEMNSNVLYVKSNAGLTIVLSNCVMRFISNDSYNKLKPLYEKLVLPRDFNPQYNHFEKIHQIYNYSDYGFVCIVSEKLTSVKTFDGLHVKPRFSELLDIIFDSISEARNILHSIGYLHNDLSLDNTGFRESDKKFVIFDFDMTSFNPARCSILNDKIRGYEK